MENLSKSFVLYVLYTLSIFALYSSLSKGFSRLSIQFPQNTAEDNQVNTYSYELWLLEDFSLVVTSCYRMKIGGGTYRSEYRTIKSYDWQDTEMDINFCCVADALENLCNLVKNHGYPLIEV